MVYGGPSLAPPPHPHGPVATLATPERFRILIVPISVEKHVSDVPSSINIAIPERQASVVALLKSPDPHVIQLPFTFLTYLTCSIFRPQPCIRIPPPQFHKQPLLRSRSVASRSRAEGTVSINDNGVTFIVAYLTAQRIIGLLPLDTRLPAKAAPLHLAVKSQQFVPICQKQGKVK